MNIFIEKKTNIGFYNLKDPLGLNLILKTLSFFSSVLFLSMFKFLLKFNVYDDNIFYFN